MRASGHGPGGALVLAGCGSEPDRSVGPGPDPGGGTGVALVFADSALQAAVEAAAAGSGDAAGLVALTAKERGIADLGGIEQLTRLEALDLYGNEIRDLTPLSGLGRLRYLDLGSNRVEEVSPLSSLKEPSGAAAGRQRGDGGVGPGGPGQPAEPGSDRQPAERGGPGPGRRLPRARRVTVEFTAPEPEDSAEVVPPEGPAPPLGASVLLFSSNRRLEGPYLSSPEVHSLDLETGEVVNLCSVLAAVPFADGAEPDSLERHYVSPTSEEPARSPDGTMVAFSTFRDGDKEIYVMDSDGGDPVNLTRHHAFDSSPAWSPDGRRIAFESVRDGGDYHIFVMNADGSGVEQLTFGPGTPWAVQPAWSPDGSSIACVSGMGTDWGIHSIDLASGELRLLSEEGLRGASPSWSPDGARIAYTMTDSADSDLRHVWVMAADGSGARQLTFAESWDADPSWSPDGSRIAFARLETRYDIYVISVEGGAEERVTDDPHDDMHPNWTPF